MRFLAIDFETATANRDSACAVGIALVDKGRVVRTESHLIQPPGNRYDPFNVRLHGITPAMTEAAAPFVEVVTTVLEWAGGLPLVAHNASFDMSVLRAGFELDGRSCPERDYYCTLLMSRSALPGLRDYKLPRVLAACGESMENHHDPSADADACARIALAIASKLGVDTVDDLGKCLGMTVGHLHEQWYQPCRCSLRSARQPARAKAMVEYVCNSEADKNGPFFDADVAFTGAMASMPREAAMQKVADRGGRPRTTVSRRTEYVVVGDLDYIEFTRRHPSSKLRKALELSDAGYPIQVLTERDFLCLLDTSSPRGSSSSLDSRGDEPRWHFGQNCKNYLPTLSKCQVLARLYSGRTDLLTERWCTAGELLVYAGVPYANVVCEVDSGHIKTKRLKQDGTLRYLVKAAWDWDGCPLCNDGGQCLHFVPHDGPMISCLKEIRELGLVHPNCAAVPTDAEIAAFETSLAVNRSPMLWEIPPFDGAVGR